MGLGSGRAVHEWAAGVSGRGLGSKSKNEGGGSPTILPLVMHMSQNKREYSGTVVGGLRCDMSGER